MIGINVFSTMVDRKKRTTLKVFSLSAAATALPVWSVATLIKHNKYPERLEISIQYETGSNHGTVILRNPTNEDIVVNIEFDGDVNVPGGSLDVRQLMVAGSVHIKPGSSRQYQLPKIARTRAPFDNAEGYRHGDQGFPISDNVIIANAQVYSDYSALNGTTPVFLTKLS
ncbi:MAG: hypothetical protein ACR2QW_19915 [bacterium]